MKIKILVENTTLEETDNQCNLQAEHGLSLYIETQNHKILLDLGGSSLFLENAQKIGVELKEVDTVIISHGHYDHGGGLGAFLEYNDKANIYIHPQAFAKYYARRGNNEVEYIGLDQKLINHPRIIATLNNFVINEEISLFSNIEHEVPIPSSNKGLYQEVDGTLVADTFVHEQILVLHEKQKNILITGCAHNGITNILGKYYRDNGAYPDVVIGGFHLASRSSNGTIEEQSLKEIGQYFMLTKAQFYTGHCTGKDAYESLKQLLEEQIDYLHTGMEITI